MDLVTINNFAGGFQNFILAFSQTNFFAVIKFLLGIYAVVVLADIFLLLIQRGLSGDIRDTRFGMNIPKEFVTGKNKLKKNWEKIRARLEVGNESAWKVAIIEADNLVDDLITRMGYPGENMGERLAGINPGQIENIEELKIAHEVRNRIIHEKDFRVEKEKAQEILGCYENFLKYFKALE